MILQHKDSCRSFMLKSFSYIFLCFLYLYLSDIYNIDLYVQNYFYDYNQKSWLISRDNLHIRYILYYGIKYSIMIFGILLIFYLIYAVKNKKEPAHIKAILFVLACIIIVPTLVAWLKWLTGVPCPSHLLLYGGPLPYEGVFGFHWPGSGGDRAACFPAGHPSGGFALLALPMVAVRKTVTALVALACGLLMSFYQMAVGAHFLSHCVTTLLFSLAFINACFFLFVRFASVKSSRLVL